MLLGVVDKSNDVSDKPVETFLLKMQPNLSIVNYQAIEKFSTNELTHSLTVPV